jgi:hypothetical protein
MTEIVNSLFGVTPESLQQQRDAALQQQAQQYAQLSPMQAAQAGFYTAGNRLGGAIGGLLGAQDPQMAKAAALQNILKQADTTTPEGLATLAQTLGQQGFGQQAMQVMDQARQARLQTAQTQKAEMSVAQEESLRKELANLGPDATEADIMKAVTKYGSADKVLATLQASSDRAAARQQQLNLAQAAADAKVEAAKAAGESKEAIARLQIEGKKEVTALAASLKAGTSGIEQELKAQRLEDLKAKAEDRTKANEAATQGRISSFDTALDTLNTIATHPGKKDVVGNVLGSAVAAIPGTNAAGFAAQLETFKAQTFLPQVAALKGMGALSDAEGKKLTDAVGALSIKMKQSEFDSQVAKIKNDLTAARQRAMSSAKGTTPSGALGTVGNPIVLK